MAFKPAFIAEGLEITDIDQQGRGVARHGEIVVFVEKAIPGDIADVRVFRQKSRFWEASVHQIIQPSAFRIAPICSHFGICGGCQWQHFQYEGQLKYKAISVEQALLRIGGLDFPTPAPILPALEITGYRNKLNFSFSARQWITRAAMDSGESPDKPALGFHLQKVFDKVYPITECHLMPDIVNQIRNEVRDFTCAQEYEYYHLKDHTGWLRTLVVRRSEYNNQIMIILVVSRNDQNKIDALFTHLQNRFPEIGSFIWIHNSKLNDSYQDLPFRVWGEYPSYLIEQLGQYKFRISPKSFFQTNTQQAERLYQIVYDAIGTKVPLIYDLYCGAGSIGIYVSALAEKIVGIEYVQDAVQDAELNCRLNSLTHLKFYAGDMKKILTPELVLEHGVPDVIITDPPRAGMDAPVVAQMLKMNAEKIIYVSCNPATQARDLALMKDQYEIIKVQPVDMFPQTTHVENIVVLQRRK